MKKNIYEKTKTCYYCQINKRILKKYYKKILMELVRQASEKATNYLLQIAYFSQDLYTNFKNFLRFLAVSEQFSMI